MKKVKEFFKTNKKIKIFALLIVFLGIALVSTSYVLNKSYAATDGTFGTCHWEIDANGKLTIAPQSGDTGCTLGNAGFGTPLPWNSNKAEVLSVEVAQGVIANANAGYLFFDLSNATSIDVANLDTSNVTYIYSMFQNCYSLTSLDLSNFDTSNVTDMSGMFDDCRSLTNLDLSSFNTSNVTNMESMFSECSSLTNIDVTSFDTSNVTKMIGMFYKCSSLTSLDVTHFNTSKVRDMYGMFENCSSLTDLDLSNFNTSKVVIMSHMFEGDSSLTSLDVTSFDTSTVEDVESMFDNCTHLSHLNISSFDLSNVDMVENKVQFMFRHLGGALNGGCKLTLNHELPSYDIWDNNGWTEDGVFPWAYYSQEINGELDNKIYLTYEMATVLGETNTPTTWVPVYSVTYNGNGGTINGDNTLVKPYRIGSKIDTKGILPTKSNSHFNKFTDTQSGASSTIEIRRGGTSANAYGSQYSDVGQYDPDTFSTDGNINLYAQYTEDPDTTMTVNRNINGASGSITNTFTYSITPDSNNPGTATGIPSSFTVVFNGDTPSGGVASKGKNIDFNSATYTEPGQYKFKIKETASTDSDTFPVSTDEWEVYVNIRNVLDYEDVPTGEYERSVYMKKVGATEKSQNMLFESNMVLTNIKITNTLKGNMANTGEYFKIKVNVGGSGTYTVSGLDSSATYEGNTVSNPSVITAGQDTYIYMKHEQEAVIGKNGNVNEIRSGVTYRVIEEESTDYTTSINGTAGKDSGNKTTSASDNNIAIVNLKEAVSPTGIILKYLPYIVLVVLVITGIILFVVAKKKLSKEEKIV